MPMFMDRHDLPGATAEDLAQAHLADVEMQDRYGVQYLTYWFDPSDGAAFCLVDAPDLASAVKVHRESHGMVASQIIGVRGKSVEDYLGKIGVLAPGTIHTASAFRTILFTDIEGSTTLTQRLGDERAMTVLRAHDTIVREAMTLYHGREVKHTGDGIMASFASVGDAREAAIAVQRRVAERNADADEPFRVRIGLAAGEPVTEHDDLFGAVVQLASRACGIAAGGEVFVSHAVHELALGKSYRFVKPDPVSLKGFDEPVQLFQLQWES